MSGSYQEQNRVKRSGGSAMPVASTSSSTSGILSAGLQLEDIKPLWSSFNPIVSRELPFAVTKFFGKASYEISKCLFSATHSNS